MKNRYVIQERLNHEIKRAVDPNDTYGMGIVRGWMSALEWVLDM